MAEAYVDVRGLEKLVRRVSVFFSLFKPGSWKDH